MVKFNVFLQVIKKGVFGAGEYAIMGKHLIITEMAHVQKTTLAVQQGCSYNYCQNSSHSSDDHVQFSLVKSYLLK